MVWLSKVAYNSLIIIKKNRAGWNCEKLHILDFDIGIDDFSQFLYE